MYIYIGLGVSLVLIYYLVIKPFIQLLLIKIKFGKQAKMIFFPIFGDIIEIEGSLKKYNDHYESFKKYFRENKDLKYLLLNVFNIPFILVGDPEIIKLVHTNHESFRKIDFLNNNSRLMGQGLLFSFGQKWKNQRQLLGKPFDFDKLKARIPMMNQVITQKLEKTYQNPLDLTRSIAGEVVIQTFFGKEAENAQLNGTEAQSEIVQLFNDITEVIYGSAYGFLKWMIVGEKQWKIFPSKAERDINRRIEELTLFVTKVIDERITKIKQEGFNKKEEDFDFLDLHLKEFLDQKNSTGITKQDIISQFITLFFAGTDTTSSVAAMCLFYLAQHQDVYDSLLKEIETIVGNGDVLDYHISKLQELNSFIWEVLRVRNPASGPLVRVANQDIMLKDLKVKKGWIVMPANFVQQHSEKYFQNYQVFDHKRFLKAQTINEDNGFVNIPFSAGGRNCIGQHMAMMEIKVMLCHIIRQFKVIVVPEKMKNLQWKAKFLYLYEPLDCIQLIKK